MDYRISKRVEPDMDGQSMTDAASRLADSANARLKEISDRAAAGVAAAGETAQAAIEQARAAGAQAGAAMNRATEQGGEALRDLSERGSAMTQYLRETTTRYPITTLVIAAAAGYALARLIRR
jgi:ElaB/YqjD/DUF883 family membrane-anchored ribosome-binding protein